MNKRAIIFDLDDTLIETFFRQYSVIKSFADSKGIPFPISFAWYMQQRKSQKLSNFQLYSSIVADRSLDESFNSFYLKHIEHPDYLMLDKLLVDLGLLKKSREEDALILLSLRSNSVNSTAQLEKLNLFHLFDRIYFLNHNKIENPKILMIQQIKKEFAVNYFIGDSRTDWEAATESDVNFVHVKTGLESDGIASNSFDDVNTYLKKKTYNADF